VTFAVRAHLRLAVLLPVLALVSPRGASADPPDARPSANADSVGRAHFQRGQKLSANGQYAAAYREFAAGYAATRRPLFLFNMAEAARANGDAPRARDAYLEFLRADPKSALAATARTRLAELDRGAGTTSHPDAKPSPPGPEPSTAQPDASAGRPDGSRAPQGTPGSSPSISTGPPTEPVPFMPPSVTRPQPAAGGLPPGRFTVERRDDADRPLWKKWPFWAVVGGVVAGGVVVFAVTRDPGTASGAGCSEIDFRPPR
jgi:hypothetical protein